GAPPRGGAQPAQSRRLLPDGLRARRHGPARGGARGDAPRHPAESDAAERAATRVESRATQMEVHAEGQLAHFNLGLAFRQKGYYGEALREYAKALDRGEDRPLVQQAMAEV